MKVRSSFVSADLKQKIVTMLAVKQIEIPLENCFGERSIEFHKSYLNYYSIDENWWLAIILLTFFKTHLLRPTHSRKSFCFR